MIIRKLDISNDLPVVVEAQNQYFDRKLGIDDLRRQMKLFSQSGFYGLVLEDRGDIVGSIMTIDLCGEFFGKTVLIRQAGNICIAPPYRHQGLALKLINAVSESVAENEIYCGLFIGSWPNIKEQEKRGEYKLIQINRYQYWLNPLKQLVLSLRLNILRRYCVRLENFDGLDHIRLGLTEPAASIMVSKNSIYFNRKYSSDAQEKRYEIFSCCDDEDIFAVIVMSISGTAASIEDFFYKLGREQDFLDSASQIAYEFGCAYLDCSIINRKFEPILHAFGFKKVVSNQYLNVRASSLLGKELFNENNWHIVSGDAM